MLPGLVLTVSLVAQSIGALVSPAARNPDAPRFVNIGDAIIQSDSATAVAPAATCAPAAPAPVVVREYVVVPAPAENVSDVEPASQEQHVDTGVEVFTGVPVAGRHVTRPFLRQHALARVAPRPPIAHVPVQQVLLPPFPTVLLPPRVNR